MIGCSLTLTPSVAKATTAQVRAEVIENAALILDLHAPELLGDVAMDAVGVGRSYDRPGQSAILLFVNSRGSLAGLPQSIHGVSTRLIRGDSWPLRGPLTSEQSAQLLAGVAEPLLIYTVAFGRTGARESGAKGAPFGVLKSAGSIGRWDYIQCGCAG